MSSARARSRPPRRGGPRSGPTRRPYRACCVPRTPVPPGPASWPGLETFWAGCTPSTATARACYSDCGPDSAMRSTGCPSRPANPSITSSPVRRTRARPGPSVPQWIGTPLVRTFSVRSRSGCKSTCPAPISPRTWPGPRMAAPPGAASTAPDTRPARRAFRAAKAHRHKAFVHLVRADTSLRVVDKLLHLGQERVDHLRPRCRCPGQRISAARLAQRHIAPHGLRVAPGQLRRRVRAASRIVRLQDLHDLPVRLGHGLSGQSAARSAIRQPTSRRDHLRVGHDGRSPGRTEGFLMSASRDSTVHPQGFFSVR